MMGIMHTYVMKIEWKHIKETKESFIHYWKSADQRFLKWWKSKGDL